MINNINMPVHVDEKIRRALQEDITFEDVSTQSILRVKKPGRVELLAKEDGLIAGLPIFRRVFELLDDDIVFETKYKDGDWVEDGDTLGVLTGDMRALLGGERTALNYLQRMSGIATMARGFVVELEGTSTKLLDTRKTTPGLRVFEKYAVKVGGAINHRFNLSDGVLLKDNHIGAAGGIKKAVQMARDYAPFVRKIEVETETLDMVQEALDAKADIIMLDNMDLETMKQAVELIDGRAVTECSGNVVKDQLKEIAGTGVDYVSSGAMTHSAVILDFSLKNMRPL